MSMTEEQAREKWCPHAIASHTNPRSKNGADGNWLHNCIASECMAWRAVTVKFNETVGEIMKPGKPYYVSDIIKTRPTDEGYCGLGGKP